MRKALDWTPYITRKAHGHHPEGSKCLARRGGPKELEGGPTIEGDVFLKFEDGDVVQLPRTHYLLGLEGPPESFEMWAMSTLTRKAREELQAHEDAEFCKYVEIVTDVRPKSV